MTTTICSMMNKQEIPRPPAGLGQWALRETLVVLSMRSSISRDAGITRRRVVLEAPGT